MNEHEVMQVLREVTGESSVLTALRHLSSALARKDPEGIDEVRDELNEVLAAYADDLRATSSN